jgi:heterodisulfide reductase subunit C
MCGLCALRCPTEIVPYNIAMLARRLFSKYLTLKAKHLEERIKEIESGKFDKEILRLINTKTDALKIEYEKRDIEK